MKGQTNSPDRSFKPGKFFQLQTTLVDHLIRHLNGTAVALYVALSRHSYPSPFIYRSTNHWERLLGVRSSAIYEALNALESHWMIERSKVGGHSAIRLIDLEFSKKYLQEFGATGKDTPPGQAYEPLTHDELIDFYERKRIK
jgi:hypothetical protein